MDTRALTAVVLLTGCAAAPPPRPVPPGSIVGDVVALPRRAGREPEVLRNAFVRVTGGPIPASPAAAEPVHLDQVSFEFVPRVFGIRVGQPLRITSQDTSVHNVNAQPFANEPFNESFFGGEERIRRFTAVEVAILLQCNVHPQMRAWVCVVDNPYFAVTGADGAFEIRGLPPGEYAVEAWHEDHGTAKATLRLDASSGARWEVRFR
jgi:plastocyanin